MILIKSEASYKLHQFIFMSFPITISDTLICVASVSGCSSLPSFKALRSILHIGAFAAQHHIHHQLPNLSHPKNKQWPYQL